MIGWILRAALDALAEYQLIYKPNRIWGHQVYVERKDER